MYVKTQERHFSAHHMLLHAADCAIEEAVAEKRGSWNRLLAAMVMTSLAVEALANAVGDRVVSADDWPEFERRPPADKLTHLVSALRMAVDPSTEPWTTLRWLSRFRNDIAYAKPEPLVETRVLPAEGLRTTRFDSPKSRLEREISLGNARRALEAVTDLKRQFQAALPWEFGIYADSWSGSEGPAEPAPLPGP